MSIQIAALLVTAAATAALGQVGTLHEALELAKHGEFLKARVILRRLHEEPMQPGAEPTDRASLITVLGAVENNLGRTAEAVQVLEQGARLFELHPGVAPGAHVALLAMLATVYTAQSRFAEAEKTLAQGKAIADANLPKGDAHWALILGRQGLLYKAIGKWASAEGAFRGAIKILADNFGPDDPRVAAEAGSLVALLEAMGRRTEAIPLTEHNLKILLATLGPQHPETIFATYHLGIARLDSAPAEADRLLQLAWTLWTARSPEQDAVTATLLNGLAAAHYKRRRAAEAVTCNQQAIDILRRVFGPEHMLLAAMLDDHAQLLRAAKRRKEGQLARQEAARIRVALGYSKTNGREHRIDIRALRGQ